MQTVFKCQTEPLDTLEVYRLTLDRVRVSTSARPVHLSLEDVKELRRTLKKIIKEIESNGNQPA